MGQREVQALGTPASGQCYCNMFIAYPDFIPHKDNLIVQKIKDSENGNTAWGRSM